jgi:hypothetical protein
MRAPPPLAVSAFQCRTSAHFFRRPPTGKIATSVITRVYAEKAAQGPPEDFDFIVLVETVRAIIVTGQRRIVK